MELNDALRRIVVRHGRLIICCALLPLIVVAALAGVQGRGYAATARIQAAAVDPSSDTQADAILNRTQGIVTSPDMVRDALDHVGAVRDPIRFAKKQVSVSRLGSSAVVTITVTDKDSKVAAGVCQALAQQATRFINHKYQAAVAGGAPQGGAYVIYAPKRAEPVSLTRTVADLALALIGGLLLGLLVAAAIEVTYPTVPGPGAFGRELGVPVLGDLGEVRGSRRRFRRVGRGRVNTSRFELVTGVRSAVERADVDVVALIGPVSARQLESMAAELARRMANHDGVSVPDLDDVSTNGAGGRPAVTTLAAIAGRQPLPRRVGLLAVAPPFAPQEALTRIQNFRAAAGWPLLGVVSTTPSPPDEESQWTSTSCPPVLESSNSKAPAAMRS